MGGGSTASRLPGSSHFGLLAPAAVMALLIGSCGGASSGGGPTTPPSASAPPPSGNNPTVTITAAGAVSPKDIQVAVGGRVTFTNQHNLPHEVSSNPHPDHTECPAINQVNVLNPGATRDTSAFTTVRTCAYHDHGDSTNTNLQGTITVR